MNGAGGPAIVGSDWPNPLPAVTTHSKPRPLPTGLDWSKHTAPDPEPAPMVDTVAQAYANEVTQHTEAEQRVERLESGPKQRGPRDRPKSTRTRPAGYEERLEVQDPTILDTIRQAYLVELASTDAIGERLGISPNTVCRILERNSIPRRQRGNAGQLTADRLQERLRQLGTTSAQIRAWAGENGLLAPRRGVLPTRLVDLWEQAHQ